MFSQKKLPITSIPSSLPLIQKEKESKYSSQSSSPFFKEGKIDEYSLFFYLFLNLMRWHQPDLFDTESDDTSLCLKNIIEVLANYNSSYLLEYCQKALIPGENPPEDDRNDTEVNDEARLIINNKGDISSENPDEPLLVKSSVIPQCRKFTIKNKILKLEAKNFDDFFSQIREMTTLGKLNRLIFIFKDMTEFVKKREFFNNSPEADEYNLTYTSLLFKNIFMLPLWIKDEKFVMVLLQLFSQIAIHFNKFEILLEAITHLDLNGVSKQQAQSIVFLYALQNADHSVKEKYLLSENKPGWISEFFKFAKGINCHLYNDYLEENYNFLASFLEKVKKGKISEEKSNRETLNRKISSGFEILVKFCEYKYRKKIPVWLYRRLDENIIPLNIYTGMDEKTQEIQVTFFPYPVRMEVDEKSLILAKEFLKYIPEFNSMYAFEFLINLLYEHYYPIVYELLFAGFIKISERTPAVKSLFSTLLLCIFTQKNYPLVPTKISVETEVTNGRYFSNQILLMFIQAGWTQGWDKSIKITQGTPNWVGDCFKGFSPNEEYFYKAYVNIIHALIHSNESKIIKLDKKLTKDKHFHKFLNTRFSPLQFTPIMTLLMDRNSNLYPKNIHDLLMAKHSYIDTELKNIYSQTTLQVILSVAQYRLAYQLINVRNEDKFSFKSVNVPLHFLYDQFILSFDKIISLVSKDSKSLFNLLTEFTKDIFNKQSIFFEGSIHFVSIKKNSIIQPIGVSLSKFKDIPDLDGPSQILDLLKYQNTLKNIFESFIPKGRCPQHAQSTLLDWYRAGNDIDYVFNISNNILAAFYLFIKHYDFFLKNLFAVSEQTDKLRKYFQTICQNKSPEVILKLISANRKKLMGSTRNFYKKYFDQHKIGENGEIQCLHCSICDKEKSIGRTRNLTDRIIENYAIIYEQMIKIKSSIESEMSNSPTLNRIYLLLDQHDKPNFSFQNLPGSLTSSITQSFLEKNLEGIEQYVLKLKFVAGEKDEKNYRFKSRSLNYKMLKLIQLMKFWIQIIDSFFELEKVIFASPSALTYNYQTLATQMAIFIDRLNDTLFFQTLDDKRALFLEVAEAHLLKLHTDLAQFNTLSKLCQEATAKIQGKKILPRLQKRLNALPSIEFFQQYSLVLHAKISSTRPRLVFLKETGDSLQEDIQVLEKLKNDLAESIFECALHTQELQKKLAILEDYEIELAKKNPVIENEEEKESVWPDSQIDDEEESSEEGEQDYGEEEVHPCGEEEAHSCSDHHSGHYSSQLPEYKERTVQHSRITSQLSAAGASGTVIPFKGRGFSLFREDSERKVPIDTNGSGYFSSGFFPQTQVSLSDHLSQALVRQTRLKLITGFQKLFARFAEVKLLETDIEQVFAFRCSHLHLLTSLANFFQKMSFENPHSIFYMRVNGWFIQLRNSIFHHQFLTDYNYSDEEQAAGNWILQARELRFILIHLDIFLGKLKSGDEKAACEIFDTTIRKNLLLDDLSQINKKRTADILNPNLFNTENKPEFEAEHTCRIMQNLQKKILIAKERIGPGADSFIFRHALDFYINQFHLFCKKTPDIFLENFGTLAQIVLKIRLECNEYRHDILPVPGEISDLFTALVESSNRSVSAFQQGQV